jgi:hypothetical protein
MSFSQWRLWIVGSSGLSHQSSLEAHRSFRGTCGLHFQGWTESQGKYQRDRGWKQSRLLLAGFLLGLLIDHENGGPPVGFYLTTRPYSPEDRTLIEQSIGRDLSIIITTCRALSAILGIFELYNVRKLDLLLSSGMSEGKDHTQLRPLERASLNQWASSKRDVELPLLPSDRN